jgi:hypothetical protein
MNKPCPPHGPATLAAAAESDSVLAELRKHKQGRFDRLPTRKFKRQRV